ncbi:MAG: hypothetical protein NVSMB25_09770 [Thermoleophilaceae bacterium]
MASESLHVTLAFLGGRPEREIPLIARLALDAVAGLAPARLRARGVTSLPPHSPRLFALDLRDEGGCAGAVQAAAAGALAAGGFLRTDERPFWPHITFARVGRGREVSPVGAEPPSEQIVANRVTLYRSHPGSEGSRYEALDDLRLEGAGYGEP